jgi:hypothetical protein
MHQPHRIVCQPCDGFAYFFAVAEFVLRYWCKTCECILEVEVGHERSND